MDRIEQPTVIARPPPPGRVSGRHRILIVGGGAGGLELATRVGDGLGRRGRADVILVDANPTHLWKPLLHEVAAGTLNSFQDELGYAGHARRHGFHYQFGRMDGLDRARHELLLAPIADDAGREIVPRRRLAYDTLVLAVGSVSNEFGTPGARDHCRFLDTRIQAEALHRDLLVAVLAAASGTDPSGSVEVAIIGAGATGVELAAELKAMAEELRAYDIAIGPEALRITLVEAAPRILPALPECLSGSVHGALEALGIRVLTGAEVARIDAAAVHLADGSTVPAALKIWAAGIKAPAFLAGIPGLETSRTGQVLVRPTLQAVRDDDVFAMGDCAHCPQPGTDRPVPARAQAAHQQASLLAKSLRRRLRHRPLPAFVYRDFGSLVSLSRHTAAGSLMGGVFRKSHLIEGWLARMAYASLYRMHQLALHGPMRTAVLVLASRLQRVTQPSLKLH